MYHMSAQGVDQRMINVHDDDDDDDDLRVVFHVHSCIPLYRSSWMSSLVPVRKPSVAITGCHERVLKRVCRPLNHTKKREKKRR